MPKRQPSANNALLQPLVQKKFITTCLYQPLPKSRDWRYGFDFLSEEFQRWLQNTLVLCFEEDFPCQHKNPLPADSHVREKISVTHWHRTTAEILCNDAWWNAERQKIQNSQALEKFDALHKQHQAHALFAHHTAASLLKAKEKLPELRLALIHLPLWEMVRALLQTE